MNTRPPLSSFAINDSPTSAPTGVKPPLSSFAIDHSNIPDVNPLDVAPTTSIFSTAAKPSVLKNIIPEATGGLDETLSNLPGVIGGAASGVYNAGKGILNLGKDAVVDTFNAVNHPIDTAKNVGNFAYNEVVNQGKGNEHLDSVGQLIQSTLGSKGALGVGQQIGNAIAQNTPGGSNPETPFSGSKLAGNTINTLLTAILPSGSKTVTAPLLESSVASAIKNGIITDAMGQTLIKYGTGLVGKSLESGAIGAGFQTATNLQEGRPIGENTKQAFFAGAAVPSVIKGGQAAVGKAVDIAKGVSTVSDESFNKNLNKALPVLKKDVKTLPAKQTAAKTAFGDIVNNKEKINILDDKGLPKEPTKYSFADTVDAQSQRLKQVYQEYTNKLSDVDKTKFQSTIKTSISKQIKRINDQLSKENSVAGRNALTQIQKELSSLRDTSPAGIQSYIESINQRVKTAPGAPLNSKQIKLANLGGEMRKVLDDSVSKIEGTGYQDLRNVYKAHKTIESQLLQAAKSELNKTPGWTDRIANLGMTAEGINFLLTHDPHTLAVGAGIKLSTIFTKWLRSPQKALSNLYQYAENQRLSSPATPQMMNPIATSSKINPIPKTLPQTKVKSKPPSFSKAGTAKMPLQNKAVGSKIGGMETKLISEAKKYKSADEFVNSKPTLYHGTSAKFDNFSDTMRGSVTGAKSAEGAIWFTDNPRVAKAYSTYAAESGKVNQLMLDAEKAETIAKKSGLTKDWEKYDDIVKEYEDLSSYDKTFERRKLANVKEATVEGDFYKVDAKGKTPQELSSEGDIDSWLNQQLEKAKSMGKDGVIFKNLDDAVGLYDVPSTHYAIFDSSKIKTKSQLIDIWNKANK